MDNVKASDVLLAVSDDTTTTPVATAGDEDEVAGIELDVVDNFVLLKVKLDGVVDLDQAVGVTDGSAIMGDDVRNTLGAKRDLLDLKEFVGSLLRGDAVDGETALDVVKETEVLARLLNRENICRYISICILSVQNTQ